MLGGNLSLSYEKPLKIVRGSMQHLYDDTGRAYLDVYNNVPLVGHSHPRVVRAIALVSSLSSVDCGGGGWEAAGAVFALALATEVAKASTAVVAAAVNRLRIRITGRLPPLRRRTHCPTGRLALAGGRSVWRS